MCFGSGDKGGGRSAGKDKNKTSNPPPSNQSGQPIPEVQVPSGSQQQSGQVCSQNRDRPKHEKTQSSGITADNNHRHKRTRSPSKTIGKRSSDAGFEQQTLYKHEQIPSSGKHTGKSSAVGPSQSRHRSSGRSTNRPTSQAIPLNNMLSQGERDTRSSENEKHRAKAARAVPTQYQHPPVIAYKRWEESSDDDDLSAKEAAFIAKRVMHDTQDQQAIRKALAPKKEKEKEPSNVKRADSRSHRRKTFKVDAGPSSPRRDASSSDEERGRSRFRHTKPTSVSKPAQKPNPKSLQPDDSSSSGDSEVGGIPL